MSSLVSQRRPETEPQKDSCLDASNLKSSEVQQEIEKIRFTSSIPYKFPKKFTGSTQWREK
jgi:hypothetical protein